jgi:phage terminase large subunit
MITTLERPAQKKKTPVVRINKVYAQLYNIHCRYMIVYGGRRSSKSVSVSQLLVRKACENVRHIIVMRKYATTIRLSVWLRIIGALDEAGMYRECDINKSDRVITLPNGSTFNFVGADDPQKLKSIERATDFWLEEANEFDEIDLDTIDAGLSASVIPSCQIWLTFNPIPIIEVAMPWLARRFVAAIPHEMSTPKIEGDICILRTWYKDNAFCPEPTIKLFKGYEKSNPELYKLWVLGVFTFLEGVIFKNWDVVDAIPEGVNKLGFGLDFGFADDPAAVVAAYRSHEELWLDELVYSRDLTNADLSLAMEAAGLKKYMDPGLADAAEPKSIRELNNYGWVIMKCDKAPDYKRAAINYLKSFRIHITKRSVNMIREFSTWSWKKDKTSGKFLPVPVDGDDHTIDATIYRTFTRQQWGSL